MTRRADSNKSMSRKQLPVVLGSASTFHKAQGLTLYRIRLNIDRKDFCFGLTYVALSRVKEMSALFLEDFPDDRWECSTRVKNTMEMINQFI